MWIVVIHLRKISTKLWSEMVGGKIFLGLDKQSTWQYWRSWAIQAALVPASSAVSGLSAHGSIFPNPYFPSLSSSQARLHR